MEEVMLNNKWIFCGLVFAFLGVTGCVTNNPNPEVPRQPDSIAGVNYNRGSYSCVNSEKNLKGQFTFGARTASLETPSGSFILECSSARDASQEDINFFVTKGGGLVSEVCRGQGIKGSFLVGTSNSMGIVQMRAFLIKVGAEPVFALLNCKAAARTDEGW